MSIAWTDFDRIFYALSTARVEDFARYVGRRRRESDIDDMPFKLAWPLVLGGYAEMAAAAHEDEDVPF